MCTSDIPIFFIFYLCWEEFTNNFSVTFHFSVSVNRTSKAHVLFNLVYDEWRLKFNLHNDSVTDCLTTDTKANALALSSCNSGNLSTSFTYTFAYFLSSLGHNSITQCLLILQLTIRKILYLLDFPLFLHNSILQIVIKYESYWLYLQ